MAKILIQHSHSTLFGTVLGMIDSIHEPVIATEDELGEGLSSNKKDILAIIIFELSDRTLKLCKLARNERFGSPVIPIAYIGLECTRFPMPFGCKRFEQQDLGTFLDYLQTTVSISTLIVEDDSAIRDVAELTLSKYMKIETASNGDDAYTKLQNNSYDMVVLDVMLPGKSGDELFQYIRTEASHTAIVVITAFDTDEREFSFTIAGSTDYIKKPFESNKVFRQQVMDATIKHHETLEHMRLDMAKTTRLMALQQYNEKMSKYV